MEKKTWKIRAMQIAMALLCLVMLSMPLYVGLQKLVLKHPSWNRGLIAAILCDAPKKNPVPEIKKEKVDWEKEYPFAEKERKPIQLFKGKHKSPAERLGENTNKRLVGYYHIVEAGRRLESRLGWEIKNPGLQTYLLGDGYWDYFYAKIDMKERAESVTRLSRFVAAQGGHFCYVQAPAKEAPKGETEKFCEKNYANQNADDLKRYLMESGVDYLDLREALMQEKTAHEFHQLFFRTDHHWLPQTAVQAARIVGEKIQRDYGVQVQLERLSLDQYSIDTKKAFFLGSQGKKVTLALAQPDDFPVLHPLGKTDFYINNYQTSKNLEGPFEITYDKNPMGVKDFYNANPYGAYGGGDGPLYSLENRQLTDFKNRKVLLIKDSFGDTFSPAFAMGIKHLIVLDVRSFTGSVETLIRKEKPDVVLLMYTPNYEGEIDWRKHEAKFDFR